MNCRTFAKSLLSLSPLPFLSGLFDKELLAFYDILFGGQKELRTYVMFNMYGSPIRWVYDNNLKPSGTDEINPHKTVFNSYFSQEPFYDPLNSNVEYSTVQYRDWHVPKLWSSQVYFRNQLVPMTNLLPHMLSIRGVYQGIPFHPVGNIKQICARNGDISLSGLAADHSKRPFPAINLGESPSGNAFCSAKGKTQLDLSYTNSSPDSNLIHYLMRLYLYDEKSDAFNTKFPKLAKNFDPFQEYQKLLNKYSNILKETSKRCPIPGLTDKKLLVNSYKNHSKDQLYNDLKRFRVENNLIAEDDFSFVFSEVRIGEDQFLEKQFALAEFLILNKLSSSIILAPPKGKEKTVSNLRTQREPIPFDQIKLVRKSNQYELQLPNKSESIKGRFAIKMDSHLVGSFFSILGSSLYFQGFTACLLELVETIKEFSTPQDNLFKNLVIHLASEFERAIPVEDGDSDHLGAANPTSLISGLFSEYKLFGNIAVNSKYFGSAATFGEAAPVEENRNQLIYSENVLNSIACLLGAGKISFRNPSLLSLQGDIVTTPLKGPKNKII